MAEEADFSLADLAGFDATEVQELRVEALPAGVYDFEVVSATLTEGANKETNAKQFIAEFKFKVTDCKSVLERGVDKESLVGRTHTEKKYIVPGEKAAEGIGYLRAFVADMGCPNEGPIGGVEGAPEGFLNGTVGHVFTAKIQKQRDRTDPTRSYSRMQLEAKKK